MSKQEQKNVLAFVSGAQNEDPDEIKPLDIKPLKDGHVKFTDDAKNPFETMKSKYNPEQKDKLYNLERENTILKSKGNLLESEILKMNTKLRRIEELMRKRKQTEGLAGLSTLPADLQKHFKDEIDEMRNENLTMKDRNQKLKAIESKLSSQIKVGGAPRPATASVSNKYAHVKGKLSSTKMKESDVQFQRLLEELKVNMIQGEKQIIQLVQTRDKIQAAAGPRVDIHGGLQGQLEEYQHKLTHLSSKIAETRAKQMTDEQIFADSKATMERKLEENARLRAECEKLSHQNMKVSHQKQVAYELSSQIDELKIDIDSTEKSIASLSQLPFRKTQTGEQSVQQRVAELQIRLQETQRVLEKTRLEEQIEEKKTEELHDVVQKLKGENDYVQKQHNDAKSKFQEVNKEGGIHAGEIHRDLFKIDKEKYAQTMEDVMIKPEIDPLVGVYDKPTKQQILALKHSNKDIAAELDKTQSLLRLQTDIERENRQYYEQEKQRMKLLAQATQTKTQEMQKRVDQQAILLNEIKVQLGLEKPQIKEIRLGTSPDIQQRSAELSDFSDDESPIEIGPQENVLDLKIIDGYLDENLIEKLLVQNSSHKSLLKNLITLVVVDFYDHESQLSDPTEGKNPQYRKQISFKNKVDNVYLQELLTRKTKLEIWLCEYGKKSIVLGYCDLSMSELVFTEGLSSDGSGKPAKISKTLNIMASEKLVGIGAAQSKSLQVGSLKVKFRMRKPVAEMMRHYRDMNEAKDVAISAVSDAMKPGALGPRQVVLNIAISSCQKLQVKHGDVSTIAPFYYYQFYTFEERYSHTGAGNNPQFNDAQSYSLTLNESTLKFLQTQTLDLIFFDDNALVTGVQRGGQSQGEEDIDDLIGIAKIPLADLAKGLSISGVFEIKSAIGAFGGQVNLKITMVDTHLNTAAHKKAMAQEVAALQQETYSEKWENEIIAKIARKLGLRMIDVELMFGIFSRGTRTCSFEDFKYCCLQRLNLKLEMSEKELDMFLNNNKKLKHKQFIEQKDFVEIFSQAIIKARNDIQNKEADDRMQMLRYQDYVQNSMHASNMTLQQTVRNEGVPAYGDFQRREALQVLGNCILNSSYDSLNIEANKSSKNGYIEPINIRKILKSFGGANDQDSLKITNLLQVDGLISQNKFEALLKEALLEARFESNAVRKFNHAIVIQPKLLAELFMSKDIDLDGTVHLDGFKSAVIDASGVSEFGIALKELQEIFNLISWSGKLSYCSYMIEIEPKSKEYFTKLKFNEEKFIEASVSHEQSKFLEIVPPIDTQSHHHKYDGAGAGSPRFNRAKERIESYLISRDVTLSMLFSVLDTNSDDSLSKGELSQKLRALHIGIEEGEIESLFRHLDKRNNGEISYAEFIQVFAQTNAAQLIRRMKKILFGAHMPIENVVNQHCQGQQIKKEDLRKMVRSIINPIADFEIDSVFTALDNKKLGFVPRNEFLERFGKDEQEQLFQTGIEDIIKPLAAIMNKAKRSVQEIYREYDQNKNELMSTEELRHACKELLKFEMTQDEVSTLKEFFRAKFHRVEIKPHELRELIEKKYVRKWDTKAALSALLSIRKKLKDTKRDITQVLVANHVSFKNHCTIREFKLKIFGLNCVTQQQINNLARYMDRRNDGMIDINEIKMAVNGEGYSPQLINVEPNKSMQSTNLFK